MDKSLGMIEYRTVSSGMLALDIMTKTAEIEIIEAQTVCPGKYIVIVAGELSALQTAIEASKTQSPQSLIDSFVLGNPHSDIFKALTQTTELASVEALGIIETFTSASTIVAADTVAKSAKVQLIEIRLSRGMCGKSYVLFTGSIASVEESSRIACQQLQKDGNVVDFAVIPRPDEKFWRTLL